MENTSEISFTFQDAWLTLKRCWVFVLVVALLVGGGVFSFRKILYEPVYSASSSFFMISGDRDTSDNTNTYNMDIKRIYDIKHLLLAPTVLDTIINVLNGEYTKNELNTLTKAPEDYLAQALAYLDVPEGYVYGGPKTRKDVKGALTLVTDEDSRFVELHTTANSQEDAQVLAYVVVHVSEDAIIGSLDVSQVRILDKSIAEGVTNSLLTAVDYIVPAMAAVLVYVIFFLAYMLDNKIRTSEDVENKLGLSVLGIIPNIDQAGKLKSRYYRYDSTYEQDYLHTVEKEEAEAEKGAASDESCDGDGAEAADGKNAGEEAKQ